MGGVGVFQLALVGLGVFFVLAMSVGVVAFVLRRQQQAIGQRKAPELAPAKPVAAVAQRTPDHAVVELAPGRALAEQLSEHCQRAELRQLRPIFEVGAAWCPPSRLFGNALTDPQMIAALAGVYLIRADMDAFDGDPKLRELGVMAVPVFFELDGDGRATGRNMTGAAWGSDTVANMSSAIARFCA